MPSRFHVCFLYACKVTGARRASGTTRALRDITNTGANGKDPLLGASTACSGHVAGAHRASGSTRALRDITNTGAIGKAAVLVHTMKLSTVLSLSLCLFLIPSIWYLRIVVLSGGVRVA